MLTLREVVDLFHGWYPPETAESWDAVGLVAGDPEQSVAKVMFAVDPTESVAREAAEWGADLLVVHHPLFLKPVHGIAPTTAKGRTLGVLLDAKCALLTAHTNADQAVAGVSEAMATALGLRDLSPLQPSLLGAETGSGRIGDIEPTTLADFAQQVADALPHTATGVRVAGDLQRPISRVAVCGGAGDFLLEQVQSTDADVYVTSDLRHHPASEFLERGGPALIDVAHWAAEWTWLPVVADRVRAAATDAGDTVETKVSVSPTDPWSGLAQHRPQDTAEQVDTSRSQP